MSFSWSVESLPFLSRKLGNHKQYKLFSFKAPFEATTSYPEDLNFVENSEEYLKRFVRNTTDEEVLMIDGLSGFTAKTYRSGRTTRMAVIFKDDKAYQLCVFKR